MRAWLFVFAAACSAQTDVERGAIIGGGRDTGDPAVVMLVAYPPDQSTAYTCTSSLIAPSLLLTAAHCVDHAGYLFGVFTGDDASAYTTTPALVAALVPAGAAHMHPSYNRSAPYDADIAVVELPAPLSPAPLPIARSLPLSTVGLPARIVGYGQIVYSQYNAAKYQADTTVASLPGDDTVVVGDAQYHTCVGDSGGPALVTIGGVETIIGADSYTDTTGCTEASHYRRTDVYADFIDPYLPQSPDLSSPPMDLSASPDLLSTSPDLSTRPDSATPDLPEHQPAASGGGCQAAPGTPSSCWLLALLLAHFLLAPIVRGERWRRCERCRCRGRAVR